LFFFNLFIANSEPSTSLLTADSVKNYLGEHPEFLDSYIQQNIHSNTIEQWISKKPQKISSSTRPSSSISMPIVSSHRNSLSTSQVKHSGKIYLYEKDFFFCSMIYDEIYFFLDFDVKTSKQISTTTAKSMNTVE